MLGKSPGFVAIAVSTLALGIGANTAIFSMANAFMFRPWPVKDAERLMVVASQGSQDGDPTPLSYVSFQDYKQQNTVFTDMTGFALDLSGLGTQGHADRIVMCYVPSNFFTMFGLHPELGRLIQPGEGDALRSAPVAVLGYSCWRRKFAGVTRLLSTLLVGVSSYDPVTYISVAALLVIVALIACYVPAHRATRVDPCIALRYE